MSGPRKSQDDFYVGLIAQMFSDLCQKHPSVSQSFVRDIQTVRSRVASEGLGFLTKTLPLLGKAIDRSLETHRLDVPAGLSRSRENASIPALMAGLLSHAYDSEGYLTEWNPTMLLQARQICYVFYKLELPYSPKLEQLAIANFLEVDSTIAEHPISFDDRFLYVAREVIAEVLDGFDPKDIIPRHGPGAVATGEKGEDKWEFHHFYSKLNSQFPYYEYFIVGWVPELIDRLKWYRSLERLHAGFAKMVLVPKDSRGPRLISCEPLEYQWIQQGVGRSLMRHLESHWLTKGHINFELQSVNRNLALQSSKDKEFATIDLKDASDRVSLQLVEYLFPSKVKDALLASRSVGTTLPDGRQVVLNKFAPMGSALCFPVESFVFWALCVCAISTQRGISYRKAADCVYVYGDDIIVTTDDVETVTWALEVAGLEVNISKCFWRGDFRESCGVDAYKGVEVTPIRVHTLWSQKPTDSSAYASYIAYANGLASRGFVGAASYLWEALSSVYGVIPFGTPTSAFPCREVSSSIRALVLNWDQGLWCRANKHTGEIQVRTRFLKSRTSESTLDSWPRLLRNLVVGGETDPSVVTHAKSVQLRTGWRRL